MAIPIEKTLDDIRQDLFARISTVQQDGWLPGQLNLNRGPMRGLIELWAWGLFQLYSFLALILNQAFPELATTSWLDLHCAQVGLERLAAKKALGTVYFLRDDSAGNVPIQKGKIVRTPPDGKGYVYRFVTLDAAVLQDGFTEVAVAVEAEEYGQDANVLAGQISEISTAVPGVDGVENRSDWLMSEGADAEDDEALRERYILAWMGVNGCTKYAYESWARSVTGVVAVRILDQHPRGQGTVDVVITGSAGIPTQNLIDDVDELIQEKRPINDDVLVKAPVSVNVTIDAELELTHGTPDDIVSEATLRLEALFEEDATIEGVTPLKIAQDVTLDLLRYTIMAVDGVKTISFTSPAADIQVGEDELAVLSSITLAYAWASEE